MSVNADSRPDQTYETSTTIEKQPAFRAWVLTHLITTGSEAWDWLVENGAEKYKIMQVSTDRYLRKMCSSLGPCESFSSDVGHKMIRYVRLKEKFWSTAAQVIAAPEAVQK